MVLITQIEHKLSKDDLLKLCCKNCIAGFLPFLKYMMAYDRMQDENVILRGVEDNVEAVAALKRNGSFKNVIVDLPLDMSVGFTREAHKADLFSGYYHFHFTSMVRYTVKVD